MRNSRSLTALILALVVALSAGTAPVSTATALGAGATAQVTHQKSAGGASAYAWQVAARLGSFGRMTPPARSPIVCVVDSGVTMTPLLEGRVVDRLRVAADPGIDDASLRPDDVTSGHGVYVAQTVILSVPWARILSVRLASDASGDFSLSLYRYALKACVDRGADVINLSLASRGTPPANDLATLRAAIAETQVQGVDIVAGAGNTLGPVLWPAAAVGDAGLAVAAMTNAGQLCPWASRGPQTLIGAPGCSIEQPYALDSSRRMAMDGSSYAAPQVAAVLAAVRALRPDLSQPQRLAAFVGLEVGLLDGDEILRRIGRGDLVTPETVSPPVDNPTPIGSGIPIPVPPAPDPSSQSASKPTPKKTAAVKPRVSLRWSGRRLVVRVTRAPARARVSVSLSGRRKALRSKTVRLTIPASLSRARLRVTVRVLDRRGRHLLTRTIRAPRR